MGARILPSQEERLVSTVRPGTGSAVADTGRPTRFLRLPATVASWQRSFSETSWRHPGLGLRPLRRSRTTSTCWRSSRLPRSPRLPDGRCESKLKLQRRGNHGESEIDGAVTVRERDLITDRIPIDFVNQSASRSPGTSFPGYVGSRSLTVTALSGLLARIIGKGTHSFFPVRSGAAGGAAELKLE